MKLRRSGSCSTSRTSGHRSLDELETVVGSARPFSRSSTPRRPTGTRHGVTRWCDSSTQLMAMVLSARSASLRQVPMHRSRWPDPLQGRCAAAPVDPSA
ncbi:hypothetical protein, partial [Mycolicibacterium fortuitum]|uniref:hypothetical protein n=1 Tax=Mycolicibacterium fortuitum TaxID=1766 RepID=UPI003AAC88BE